MSDHSIHLASIDGLPTASAEAVSRRDALRAATRRAIEEALRDARQLASEPQTIGQMGFIMAELWRAAEAIENAPEDPFGAPEVIGTLIGFVHTAYRRIAATVSGRAFPGMDAFDLITVGLLPGFQPSIVLRQSDESDSVFQQAASIALARSWRSPREAALEEGARRLQMPTAQFDRRRWVNAVRICTDSPMAVREARVLRHAENYLLNRVAQKLKAEAALTTVPRDWVSRAAPLVMPMIGETKKPTERGARVLRAGFDTIGSYYGIDFVENGVYIRMDDRARAYGPEVGYLDPLVRLSEEFLGSGNHELAGAGLLLMAEVNKPAARVLANAFGLDAVTSSLARNDLTPSAASEYVVEAFARRDERIGAGTASVPSPDVGSYFGAFRALERFSRTGILGNRGSADHGAATASAVTGSFRIGRHADIGGIADELMTKDGMPTRVVDPGHEHSGARGTTTLLGYEFDGQRLLDDTSTLAGAFVGMAGAAGTARVSVPMATAVGAGVVVDAGAAFESNRQAFLERSRAAAELQRDRLGESSISEAASAANTAREVERMAGQEVDMARNQEQAAADAAATARSRAAEAERAWQESVARVQEADQAVTLRNAEVADAHDRVVETNDLDNEDPRRRAAQETLDRSEESAADAQEQYARRREEAEAKEEAVERAREQTEAAASAQEAAAERRRAAEEREREARNLRERAEEEEKRRREEEKDREERDAENPDGRSVHPDDSGSGAPNPERARDLLVVALQGTIYPPAPDAARATVDPGTAITMAAEKMRISLASLVNPLPPEAADSSGNPAGSSEHPMALVYPARDEPM